MTQNERIRKMFTTREVLCNVTDMVEYIFDSGTDENCPPFSPSDVVVETDINCPECGAEESSLALHLIDADEVQPIFDNSGAPDEQYLCPVCMAAHAVPEEAKQCCAGLEVYRCVDCGEIVTMDQYDEMISADTGHILSWFIVTPWLASKLQDLGEPVIPSANLWGRTRVADDTWNDSVIDTICSALEILVGQKNDWSKHFYD